MATNEFDQLENSAPAGNTYDSLIKADLAEQNRGKAQAVQQSVYQAQGMAPEQAARIRALAVRTGVADDLIEGQEKEIEDGLAVAANDYDALIKRSPRFAEFVAKNKTNAALTKDDQPALEALEDATKQHSFAGDALRSLGAGFLNMASGLAKLPALSAGYVGGPEALQGDIDFQQMRAEALKRPVPEVLYKNAVTNFLDDKAKSLSPEDLSVDIVQALRDKETGKAARALSMQIVSNVPQLAMIAVSRGAGLPMMFGMGAGSKMAENLEKGIDPETARLNALASAGIETGIESIGGIGSSNLKNTIQQVAKTMGPKSALQVIKSGVKEVLKTGGEEGLEELATSISQDLLDYGTGVNPDATKGMVQRAANAFLVGAGSGVAVGGIHHAPMMMAEYRANHTTETAKSSYQAIGQAAIATQLKDRSPEAQKEFIDSLTKDTSIENVYLSVEQAERYFQTKGIDPALAMEEIGVLREYTRATEAGTDMQIPYSDWIQHVAPTEHYEGLADDIKFDPAAETVNERKKASKEAREDLKRLNDMALEQDLKHKNSSLAVREDVQAQLVEAGYSPKDARTNALLFESFFGSLSERTGEAPYEIYSRYGLDIQNRPEEIIGEMTAAQTAFNQAADPKVMAELNALFPVTGDVATDDAAFTELQKDPERYKQYLSLLDQLGTREERARAMGFNETGYHGVRSDLRGIKTEFPEAPNTGYHFTTQDPEFLETYTTSGNAGPHVYPLKTKGADFFDPDNAEHRDAFAAYLKGRGFDDGFVTMMTSQIQNKTTGWMTSEHSSMKSFLLEAGFKGQKVWENYAKNAATILNTDLRSVNAAFDPRRANSAQILAQSDGALNKEEIRKFNNLLAAENTVGLTPSQQNELADVLDKSRLDRARGMGFDTSKVYYHGTANGKFNEFRETNVDGIAAFFSPDSEFAEKFANDPHYNHGGDNPHVFEVYLRTEKTFDYEGPLQVGRVLDRLTKKQIEKLGERYADGDDKGRARIEYLIEAGNWEVLEQPEIIKAIKAEGFDSMYVMEGGVKNVAVFDAKDIRAIDAEFLNPDSANIYSQAEDEKKRGQIRFGADRQFNIDLFKDKNLSTLLHESGHFFLEVMGDYASQANVAEALKDDYAATLKWLGVESRDQIKVEHHEKFARGFEQYLMKGEAPNRGLRKAFATFKTWLTNIYLSARALNVEVSEEMTRVFDRMLAADSQVDEALAVMSFNPLFTDAKTAGMNDKEAARYEEAKSEMRLHSQDIVRGELMKDELQRQTKAYKARREEIENEIRLELEQSRKYKAISLLTKGTLPDGSEVEPGDPIKISKASLKALVGKEDMKRLPRGITAKDAFHVEQVAEFLDYGSGSDLVRDLTDALSLNDEVKRQADLKLKEEYPSLLEMPESDEIAVQAVHNDSRARMLRLELEHMASNNLPALKDVIRKISKRVPSEKAVKDQAAAILGSVKITDVKPIVYQRAEIRSAKEAGELLAKGDIEAAFEAKRRELLNHELYRAAVEAREQIGTDVQNFKTYFRKSNEEIAKSRDVDIVNAAKAVLTFFSIVPKSKENLEPADYLKKMQQYDPETYQTVVSMVNSVTENAQDYRSLTYDEFVSMSDSVKALWDLAKTSREIFVDGKRMDREQVKLELIDRLGDITTEKSHEFFGSNTALEALKTGFLSIGASLRRVEHFTHSLGPEFTKYIWRPVSEGITEYRLQKNEVLKQYRDTFKILDHNSLTNKQVLAPELGGKFTNKAEVLGAILHRGNDSNFRKLLLGRGWAMDNGDGTMDTSRWDQFEARMWKEGVLTENDYKWAQAVWDLNETLKPRAQKAHKEMYGFHFDEITANEFETPFGKFKGGYVPAIVDQNRSEAAAIRNEKEMFEKGQNSFMFPSTGRGFTKGRVEYNAPLSLDINQVGPHIDKVLRFSYIEPSVKQVARIVTDEQFRASLANFNEHAGSDMLMPWLQRAASQRVNAPTGQGTAWRIGDRVASVLRSRTGMNIMAGNTINVLQNYTGIAVALNEVKAKYLRNATWDLVRNAKELADRASEKSAWMRNELESQIGESQREIEKMTVQMSRYESAKAFFQDNAYILQKISQNHNNLIVWSGAYDQFIERGLTEREAVQQADGVVRRSQSSMAAEDVSRFETGSPILRMFTQFYSYFNNLANYNVTAVQQIARDVGLRKGAGALLFLFMTATYLPAVFSELIRKGAAGSFDEDDDDQYLDDVMDAFFFGPLKFVNAQVPLAGQVLQLAANQFNDKHYDDKLAISPAISALESMVRAPKEVYEAVHDKSKKNPAIRDGLTLMGVLTGLPMGAAARPIRYLTDVETGTARPTGPVDFVRGTVTGKK